MAVEHSPAGKYFIHTYGCQMNEYDSQRLADSLGAGDGGLGMTAADTPADADVILLNTCAIREKAQEKVYSDLGRYRALKAENPDLVIGVGGCVATQEGKGVRKRAPFVDLVFGPTNTHQVADMIRAVRSARTSPQKQEERQGRKKLALVDVTFKDIAKFDALPAPGVRGPRAYLSIMEGCSKYCSFCVVPYTRGEEVSRRVPDILAEAKHLAASGAVEITLLGQNVNGYHHTWKGAPYRIGDIIAEVAQVKGIQRIRFTTSHPLDCDHTLVDAFRYVPELASHFHLPVQSGSDKILRTMKRNYTAAHYRDIIAQFRDARENLPIATDIIVGFPGESDTDFDATLKLAQDIGFDTSYSFIYSRRPGTPAAQMPDQVEPAVAKRRLAVLQELLSKSAGEISRKMLHSVVQVLVTGPSRKGQGFMQGRTENNRVVNFRAPSASDQSLTGKIVAVTLTEALPNSFRGSLRDTVNAE